MRTSSVVVCAVAMLALTYLLSRGVNSGRSHEHGEDEKKEKINQGPGTLILNSFTKEGRRTLFKFSFNIPAGQSLKEDEKKENSNQDPNSPLQSLLGGWKLEFPPDIRKVVINVGSHIDPPDCNENDTVTIAVEPVLKTAAQISQRERRYVITAAISDQVGFSTLHLYNWAGVSSSLGEANNDDEWTKGPMGWAKKPEGYDSVAFVPVLPLSVLLAAIPEEIEIIWLKTDMQGYDLKALTSAGNSLKRVYQIMSEVNCLGYQTYKGPNNSLSAHIELMSNTLGYYLVTPKAQLTCQKETDLIWTREAGAPLLCGLKQP